MYYVLTCDGYKTETDSEGTALPFSTIDDAVAWCRQREEAVNDGFCRVVTCNGELVADAEGEWDLEAMNAPDPFDLACERRYD